MDKEKVLPGQFLCTEEEFTPGKGSFSENGEVYSDTAGTTALEPRFKRIDVQARKPLRMLSRGATIFGRIMFVKENSASVALLQDPMQRGSEILGPTMAMLPIRNVSSRYVEKLRDEFRVGDLIKAKVTKASNLGVDLATDDPRFGVVKAFCVKCRQPLHLFGQNLRCLNCGSNETRKISSDYLVK
jgi:exosome complex component CSL4